MVFESIIALTWKAILCGGCCGSLCGNYHVNAYSACQLGNACYGQFYFFSCSHYQVSELVDDDHDVWHELVAFLRV